jgi:hypothetical protein
MKFLEFNLPKKICKMFLFKDLTLLLYRTAVQEWYLAIVLSELRV